MKLQTRLKGAVNGLVDELMVSFPVGRYDAQVLLATVLQSQKVIRLVRSSIELKQMEEDCQIMSQDQFKMEAL